MLLERVYQSTARHKAYVGEGRGLLQLIKRVQVSHERTLRYDTTR